MNSKKNHMRQKIAVAIIHGVGVVEPNFADKTIKKLRKRFAANGAPKTDLIMKPVLWSPVLQATENELWKRLAQGGRMSYIRLRQFMVDFAADAIAYQPVPKERRIYDSIHKVFAKTLRSLAKEAGPKAPLCVISHSLGSVIASNYFYDLQENPRKKIISKSVLNKMGDTPLEKDETLSLFYTMGSPIALWSLRYPNFGTPIQFPPPKLKKHWPNIKGEWINYFDKDDVIGYPLRRINAAYNKAVTADKAINAGGFLTNWTPLSHKGYWADNEIIKPIAKSLAGVWRKINK